MVTYSISKTNADIGETITLSRSENLGVVTFTFWIIDLQPSDYDFSFGRPSSSIKCLSNIGKIFAIHSGLSATVTISDDHTIAHTLTPITISVSTTQYANSILSTPIWEIYGSSTFTVDIGEPIEVNFNRNIYNQLKFLVNRWTKGKEDKTNKVTSWSNTTNNTRYPTEKLVKDSLDEKVDNYSKVVTSFLMPNYVYSTNNWIDDNHVEISGGGSLSFDFSSLEDVGDYIEFTCGGSGGNPIGSIDGNVILITKNIRVTKTSNGFEYLAYSLTNEEISGDFDGKFGIENNMGTTCTMYFSSKRLYHTVPLIDRIYPIGSIYISVNSTNPSLFIGGTWEQIQDTFLLASGTTYENGSTGGSATVTLTSAQSGVPAHSHKYQDYNTTYTLKTTNRKPGTSTAVAYGTSLTAGGGATERTSSNNTAANASQAHENMPPYLAVYMWERVG